jgi:hypothetical protein
MGVRQFAACNRIRINCKIIYLGRGIWCLSAINSAAYSFNRVFGAEVKVKFQIQPGRWTVLLLWPNMPNSFNNPGVQSEFSIN